MADDFYFINLIASYGNSETRLDQLPNPDWLVITGSYEFQSEIRLSWTISDGVSDSGSGIYFECIDSDQVIGSRATILGFMENAQGSGSADL